MVTARFDGIRPARNERVKIAGPVRGRVAVEVEWYEEREDRFAARSKEHDEERREEEPAKRIVQAKERKKRRPARAGLAIGILERPSRPTQTPVLVTNFL